MSRNPSTPTIRLPGALRRTEKVFTFGRPVTRNLDAFGYDALGQVVSARFGEGAAPDLYDYDPIGNFTSNRLRGAWTQFDANELNEYATLSTPSTSSTPSTTALSYDPDGNLLTNGVWSYAYDSMNRLSAAVSNGVAVAEYAYDAFWRRVGRRAGGAEHRTLYDDWNPVRESVSTGAGTAACDYHWGKDLSGSLQGAGGVGGLLAVRRADGLFLPSYDNLGNVVAYADVAGSVVAAYAYDAFGRTASASGPLAATFAHGFSTKPLDRETGLHYYGYRFYASGMGRWMNRDPINEIDGVDLFQFISNRCGYWVDSVGLASFQWGASCACIIRSQSYYTSIFSVPLGQENGGLPNGIEQLDYIGHNTGDILDQNFWFSWRYHNMLMAAETRFADLVHNWIVRQCGNDNLEYSPPGPETRWPIDPFYNLHPQMGYTGFAHSEYLEENHHFETEWGDSPQSMLMAYTGLGSFVIDFVTPVPIVKTELTKDCHRYSWSTIMYVEDTLGLGTDDKFPEMIKCVTHERRIRRAVWTISGTVDCCKQCFLF